jgi:prepilin-type N-terminal cleavage/methylation domain-containing protein/prepilin-type processing-associated H-X9-DG protein
MKIMESLKRRTDVVKSARTAFTLIELLVVIAIVAILASLLLPALSNAKEESKVVKCMSHQKQIGLAFRMYQDDNNSKFPPIGKSAYWNYEYGGGDSNPRYQWAAAMLAATNRPLWPYAPSPRVFQCPADRGTDAEPWFPKTRSLFAELGTSYRYNENPWCEIRPPHQLADPKDGLAGKPESWIPEPLRHVLLTDVGSLPWRAPDGGFLLQLWHYSRGGIRTRDMKNLSPKAVMPMLFVDGHVARFNLTRHIRENPDYPAEPTANWMWYVAAK